MKTNVTGWDKATLGQWVQRVVAVESGCSAEVYAGFFSGVAANAVLPNVIVTT